MYTSPLLFIVSVWITYVTRIRMFRQQYAVELQERGQWISCSSCIYGIFLQRLELKRSDYSERHPFYAVDDDAQQTDALWCAKGPRMKLLEAESEFRPGPY